MMKNKKMGIVAVLVMLVAVTLNAVGGTYAKYISSVDATDEARVAHWYLNGDSVTDSFELFSSSYSKELTLGDEYTYVQAFINDDMMTYDNVVAPGTSGEYTFSIEGEFETDFTLNIELGENSYNGVRLYNGETVDYDPIEFSIDGSNWFKYDQLESKLNEALGNDDLFGDKVYKSGVYSSDFIDNAIHATIYWRWQYHTSDANDVKDTELGNKFMDDDILSTEPRINLELTITATQYVPEA